MKYHIMAVSVALLVSTQVPTIVLARNNVLTGGVSLAYDFQERTRDGEDIPLTDSDEDDYSRLVFSPFIQILSTSQRDSIELLVEPGIRYDLDDSDTEFDSNFMIAAERALTRAWQIEASNSFFIGDETIDADEVDSSDPELTDDLGRRRFWRNSFSVGVENRYKVDSLFSIGGSWIVLRNDDDDDAFDEFDRYTLDIANEHRFTARWRGLSNLSVVRGDFKENDTNNSLSDDLYEYEVGLGIENNSIDRNPLTLSYRYVAIRYDEDLQDDSDIHEATFTWRRDFSSRLFTVVGAGPSYVDIEGGDSTWGGNGLVEINYTVQRGSYNFTLEKGYDPDNFTGTDERGVIDSWDARFVMIRQLSRALDFDGRLSYYREEREETILDNEDVVEDRYRAGVGFDYTFWRYYTIGVEYTFTHQESDDDEDDYDDHRVLVSLTWERDLMRW